MKIGKILGLLGIAAAVTAQVACSSVGPNSVVATVNGEQIYRWEVDNLYEKNRETFESTNGISLDDVAHQEDRLNYRKDLLEMLIADAAATIKAKATGYDLTDEEKTELDKRYEEYVAQNVENFMKNEADGDEEKAKRLWEEYLKESHLTNESLKGFMYDEMVREKLSADLYKDIGVDEATIEETYQQMLDDQKKWYDEDPERYADDAKVPSGKIVYNPAGFVRVKQIMISLPEEIDEEIAELTKEEVQLLSEKTSLSQEKGASDESVKAVERKLKDVQAKKDLLYEQGYEQIQSRSEEALAQAQSGEDFDALIAEYGDDPGMEEYPINEVGYLVGEKSDLLKAFKDAALALENVGDITSELVKTTNGYHIIKLVSRVEEGAIPLNDEIRQFITDLQTIKPMVDLMFDYGKKAAYGTVDEDGNVIESGVKVEKYYSKL